ncbi:Uncharacterised protein [Neisseria gonorrhoeae]|uniref:Uncharacterized protein n=1 Tax=Neisseria gonorrhoeae TaxID=485 RepID=A0A378W110_NEIGO|nr:Uncharacterised protein [Neisseria gonorrhoeae]
MLGFDFVGVFGGVDVVFGGVGNVAVVGARNRLSAEPFYRTGFTLGPQGEFLFLISLFTPLESILAVTTPFSTVTLSTYLPLISEADATPASPLFAGHSP